MTSVVGGRGVIMSGRNQRSGVLRKAVQRTGKVKDYEGHDGPHYDIAAPQMSACGHARHVRRHCDTRLQAVTMNC